MYRTLWRTTMTVRKINHEELVKNYDTMIETLEYDSMRSAGKAKLNAEVLVSLHNLRDRYSKKIKAHPVKKEVSNNG